jgi:hypothetical protein
MSDHTLEDDIVRAPTPDFHTVQMLFRWLEMTYESNPLLQAGANRNALRHANGWGPILIAALVESGHLSPGESPLDALRAVCDLSKKSTMTEDERKAVLQKMEEMDLIERTGTQI